MSAILVWLTDQGAESLFASLQPIPLLDLVPATAVEDPAAQVDEVDFAPELPEPGLNVEPMDDIDFAAAEEPGAPELEENLRADVTNSLEANDLLHCVHNATKDLCRAMGHHKSIVASSKVLADLLRKKEPEGAIAADVLQGWRRRSLRQGHTGLHRPHP